MLEIIRKGLWIKIENTIIPQYKSMVFPNPEYYVQSSIPLSEKDVAPPENVKVCSECLFLLPFSEPLTFLIHGKDFMQGISGLKLFSLKMLLLS